LPTTNLNYSNLKIILLLFILTKANDLRSQSISQIWGNQTDLQSNDAFTAVAFDPTNQSSYLIGFASDIEMLDNDERLLDLFIPPSNVHFHDFGGDDILIIKISMDGELEWAINIGGEENDMPTGAICDSQGNLYIVGSFEDDLEFNDLTTDAAFAFTDTGGIQQKQAFICSYSPEGEFRWARQEGGSGDDAYHSITNTSTGVVALGHFTENNTESLQGVNVSSINDDTDVFIAKYDHFGQNLWLLAGGSTENDYDSTDELIHSKWDITSFNDTVYFGCLFSGFDFNFDYSTTTTPSILTT
jgi:hypothetical protein